MFYHSDKLQYEVKCSNPDPIFAKMLQQAIGGVEGEIRVAMQYMFQAFGAQGPAKYRDMLMETAAEELGHIEMLSHAVALNLKGAPTELKENIAGQTKTVELILGGMSPRQYLSTGLHALPADSEGNAFDASHVYASGNIAADMLANVTAESTGRILACRLYHMANCPDMKDMLKFLIARDTMHQNQWLAAWEEVGGKEAHPIPDTFPQDEEMQEVSYKFLGFEKDGKAPPEGRWSSGTSVDGRGEFTSEVWEARGSKPDLGEAPPEAYAQKAQTKGSMMGLGSKTAT
jgi:Mn-containing catalase